MEDQVNVCETCLSSGRHLVSTSEIRSELKEIKFEELEEKAVCWECHRIIMKFYSFKKQVRNAQTALNKKLQKFKTFSKLLIATNNNFDYELVYNCDPLTNITEPPLLNVKSEQKMKEEINITESFTLNYDSDDDKKLQVFVDIIKNERKAKKKRSLPLKKKIKEADHAVLKEKFKTVSLTEEDVLRSREEKRRHPNYKKVPYKCDTCVLGFTKMENYHLHFEKHHDKVLGAQICNVCSTRFPKRSSLERHQNRHYFQYACTLCDYKTSAKKAAVNHCTYKHALDEKDRIHCKQCPGVFRTSEDLAAHTKTEHLLFCKDCGEKFKGQHTLRTHRVRIHAVKREFVCEMCKRTFLTKSRLESHMIGHGQTVARRLAYCTLCRVQYKNIHVYRNHVRNSVEHSQNRYQCPECNKKFASKVYWTKHYNFYHLNKSQYKCEACNKLFISKWRLKNHRQKHHGLSRSRDHGCNECGKKFYTLTTLRGHLLTHSEQRSYMCSDCGDTFKQRPALYTHERRVHKGGEGANVERKRGGRGS